VAIFAANNARLRCYGKIEAMRPLRVVLLKEFTAHELTTALDQLYSPSIESLRESSEQRLFRQYIFGRANLETISSAYGLSLNKGSRAIRRVADKIRAHYDRLPYPTPLTPDYPYAQSPGESQGIPFGMTTTRLDC
jgi:hypothetical protein